MARIVLIGAGEDLLEALLKALEARGVARDAVRVPGASDPMFDDESVSGPPSRELRAWLDRVRPEDLHDAEIAVVVGAAERAVQLAPIAREAEVILVDATGGGFSNGGTLVFPGLTTELLAEVELGDWLALPQPGTAGLLMALAPIQELSPLVRVVVTVLRPASVRGGRAIEELSGQAVERLGGRALEPEQRGRVLAFGLRPVLASVSDGSNPAATMAAETRILLGTAAPLVSASIIDAGVFAGIVLAVHLETERPLDINEVAGALARTAGIRLAGQVPLGGDEEEGVIAMLADPAPGPVEVMGSLALHVAGLETDLDLPAGLRFFLVFDDRLRGLVVPLADLLERLLGRDD